MVTRLGPLPPATVGFDTEGNPVIAPKGGTARDIVRAIDITARGFIPGKDTPRFLTGGTPQQTPSPQRDTLAQQRSRGRQVLNTVVSFITKDVNQIASDLRKSFTANLRTLIDRNQRLQLQQDLKNDLSNLKNTSSTFINNLKISPENLADKSAERIQQDFSSQSNIQKFSRTDAVLEPFRSEDFEFERAKEPLSKRAKNKFIEVVGGLGAIPFASSTALTEVFTEAEKQLAEQGRFIPTKEEQIIGGKKETLEFLPEFLTDEELEKLSFGGLDTLVKREQSKLDFNVNEIIKEEVKKKEPQFQKDIEEVVNSFQDGNLNRDQAIKQLTILEQAFEKLILSTTSPLIDVEQENVNFFIKTIAKKQRKVRAAILAPVVFGEGFLFGKVLALAGAGIGAGATALGLKGVSEAGRLALGAGFIGLLALQTPQIVAGLREDPLAFLLENAPFLAGAVVGANPKVVKKLGNAGKRLVRFEKKLFNDTRAKAGTKGRTKQKQVQVQKSRRNAKLSRKG